MQVSQASLRIRQVGTDGTVQLFMPDAGAAQQGLRQIIAEQISIENLQIWFQPAGTKSVKINFSVDANAADKMIVLKVFYP